VKRDEVMERASQSPTLSRSSNMSFFTPSSVAKPSKIGASLSSSVPLISAPLPPPEYLLLEVPKELLAVIEAQEKKGSGQGSSVDNGKRGRNEADENWEEEEDREGLW